MLPSAARSLTVSAVVLCALAGARDAAAQPYPSRPIRVIVPYTAGTGVDTTARLIVRKVSDLLGTNIIVENRTGAGGTLAAQVVKEAAPDGYTLLQGDLATQAANVTLMSPLPYDPEKDFQPITGLYQFPSLLSVYPGLGVKSAAELAALAKTKPGGLSYASQGVGSGGHLLAAIFCAAAGATMVHVPYPGAGPARTDLIAGRVDFTFNNYFTLKGDIEGGAVKALGVSSMRRLAVAPDIPTMAEAGYPEATLETWFALFGPAGMDAEIVQRLHDVFIAALKSPEVSDQLVMRGYRAIPSTPAELSNRTWRDIVRMRGLIAQAGASAR
jgi:tripartite-type tricarboxylate transporter receptor subunit TctC